MKQKTEVNLQLPSCFLIQIKHMFISYKVIFQLLKDNYLFSAFVFVLFVEYRISQG